MCAFTHRTLQYHGDPLPLLHHVEVLPQVGGHVPLALVLGAALVHPVEVALLVGCCGWRGRHHPCAWIAVHPGLNSWVGGRRRGRGVRATWYTLVTNSGKLKKCHNCCFLQMRNALASIFSSKTSWNESLNMGYNILPQCHITKDTGRFVVKKAWFIVKVWEWYDRADGTC